jgi:hypothetical protein
MSETEAGSTETATAWTPVCWIHGVPEPDLPGDYKACGECWHVWRTAEEFQHDADEARGEHEPDLDRVWSCPLCTHDF